MVVAAPHTPDIRRATAELLKGRTDAEGRSSHQTPRAGSLPRILVEHDGDLPLGNLRDLHTPRGRVIVNCYGNSPDQAWRVAYQARDVILPPENIVTGVVGTQEYTDEEGNTRTLVFSGAQLESGPRESATARTRVITSYLIDYYRSASG